MSHIIYVNNKKLLDPRIQPVLDAHPQHNWKNYHLINTGLLTGMNTCYSRIGANQMPFKDTIVDMLNLRPPVYDKEFQDTFADITDHRYYELQQCRSNRPWLIMWSGGIDSTVVVTSILKNSTAAERGNIYIACNKISVYENPRFFYNFIQPNFKLMHSGDLDWSKLLDTYYIIDGEAADQLHAGSAAQKMAFQYPESFDRNCHTQPDELIDYLSYFGNQNFAKWFYEKHINNIQSQDCPVETYHDFFWWSMFNYCWITIRLRPQNLMKDSSPGVIKKHLADHTQWFSTDSYQLWAMNNNQPGIKYGKNLGEFKLEMKRYIHSLDHNDYYLKFKTKLASVSRRYISENQKWFCMLNDYSYLSLENDLNQILELLPEHIRD